jgi:hypothetical protein
LFAFVCAHAGAWLNPPAIARWSAQSYEQDQVRAALAMVGIRHLPMFLLAVAAGNLLYTVLKNTSCKTVAATSVPYILYLLGAGVWESLDIGEPAWSWLSYEPAYFVWPHFIAVPAGLYAASRMVRRRRAV